MKSEKIRNSDSGHYINNSHVDNMPDSADNIRKDLKSGGRNEQD